MEAPAKEKAKQKVFIERNTKDPPVCAYRAEKQRVNGCAEFKKHCTSAPAGGPSGYYNAITY